MEPQPARDPSSSNGAPEHTGATESSATAGSVVGSNVSSSAPLSAFSGGPSTSPPPGGPPGGVSSPFGYQQCNAATGGAGTLPGRSAGVSASASSSRLPAPQQLGSSTSGHCYHAGIKSSRPTASSIQQTSRHAALLRLRRSDRDKAVASRRRQFVPPEAPPLPESLAPIVQRLVALFPLPPFLAVGAEGAGPGPAHEEALRLVKLLHELIACFPSLLSGSPLSTPAGTPSSASSSSSPSAPSQGMTAGLDLSSAPETRATPMPVESLVQPMCDIVPPALQAGSGFESPGADAISACQREFALRLLQHACGCIAAAAAAQPLPEGAVQCWLPLLFSVFRTLTLAHRASGATPAGQPGTTTLRLLMRRVQQEVVYALANIAADYQGGVLELGGASLALQTMHDALLELAAIPAASPEASAPTAPFGAAEAARASGCAPALRLRTGGWLLANLLRPPLFGPAALAAMLGCTLPETGASDGGDVHPGGVQVLCALLHLEVEQQHAAMRLPANDDRRGAVAEGLWCLLLFLEAIFCGHPPIPPQALAQGGAEGPGGRLGPGWEGAAAAEEKTAKTLERVPELVPLLLRLVFEAFQGAETRRETRRAAMATGPSAGFSFGATPTDSMGAPPKPTGEPGSGGAETASAEWQGGLGDSERDRLNRVNENASDILVPALKILALLCSSIRVRTSWADTLVTAGGDAFRDLVSSCFAQQGTVHRGVLCATLSLVANLAAGLPPHTAYVVPLAPAVAAILHSSEPFDIRREAAVSLLHMALNHGKKHLDEVVRVEPSVVQGMLDILEQNKYDRASVLIALDFLNGVLEAQPGGRVEVYRRDGIAKIESAQFLHDAAVDDKISWMVSHYFDDFNEAEEEDEEAVERVCLEETALASQFFDFSKGASQ
ncbi:hypothetical protein BESB_005870 [Besnoitia besnoiti]|uniref:Armadillo/beta-catenin family repeat-containing protein n=1 Tax=Besnoitia besnoiti TaxID=94643 RepID=A0A2A9MPH0_BESBE|nr:hypothetical protein BESB_005870 [Besnoitia besnoiti]PFH38246.1 hypothetical protein BESB_005870 [Besnoitia besnoiti]